MAMGVVVVAMAALHNCIKHAFIFFMAPALIKRGVTALPPHVVLASPFFAFSIHAWMYRLMHPAPPRINSKMTHARDKGIRPFAMNGSIDRQ
jgi:hypothetical protein